MAVLVLFEAKVKSGMLDTLVGVLDAALSGTRGYDGCIDLNVYTKADENLIMVVEHWQSEERYNAYLAWRAETGGMEKLLAFFEGEPNIRFFDPVDV